MLHLNRFWLFFWLRFRLINWFLGRSCDLRCFFFELFFCSFDSFHWRQLNIITLRLILDAFLLLDILEASAK